MSPSLSTSQEGRGEDQDTPMDTPAINDNFWRIDFLIVQVHRMTFLDDILGSDLCSGRTEFLL